MKGWAEMLKVVRPAAHVKQGKLTLYTTSLRVRDLLTPNFYDIARLDPEVNDKGYQRLLNNARAKKLAAYLVDGHEELDAFLPTSVFLATDKVLEFNTGTNTLTIDVEKVCPFNVVDGQHRIEGLRLAAEKNPELLEFEVPVNIAVDLDEVAQMCHFLIVNTTQKSVDKGVEQRIYARLHSSIAYEEVPTLPRWIRKIVDRGDDERALRIVDFLNTSPDSPWCNKIKIANQEDATGASITQKSFAQSLKKYVLVHSNPLNIFDAEDQKKILLNYWKAIANLLHEDSTDQPTVLFKYVGVDVFHRFSPAMFHQLAQRKDFRVSTVESLFRDIFEHIEDHYSGMGDPTWWMSSDGEAGKMNASALGALVTAMNKALSTSLVSSAAIQI